jgi:hypothetical protein
MIRAAQSQYQTPASQSSSHLNGTKRKKQKNGTLVVALINDNILYLFEIINGASKKLFCMSFPIKKFRYWPPSHKAASLSLPSERKLAFVHLKRNDIDGTRWEPVLSVTTRDQQRLVSFDREEFVEFKKVSQRLLSIGNLWKAKLIAAKAEPPKFPDLSDH